MCDSLSSTYSIGASRQAITYIVKDKSMLEKYEQRISKLCIKAVNANNMHQSTKPVGLTQRLFQLLLEHVVNTAWNWQLHDR